MTTPKVTIGRLKEVLSVSKKYYEFLNDETKISWIFHVDESNIDFLKSLKAEPVLGSIIFGIEWIDDEGYLCKGTLCIEPEPTNNPLS